MITDYGDIAEYIIKNYRTKVIEVGVGGLPHVAMDLKDRLDVVVTDVKPQNFNGLRFFRDDIFTPDLEIYKNAALIYSVRPPLDLQVAMAKVARYVGADLIIRPFGNEKADLSLFFRTFTLVNYKKARFFLYK